MENEKEIGDIRLIESIEFDVGNYACIEAGRVGKNGKILTFEEPAEDVRRRAKIWMEKNWNKLEFGKLGLVLRWVRIEDYAEKLICNEDNMNNLYEKKELIIEQTKLMSYGYNEKYLGKALVMFNSIFMAASVPFIAKFIADTDVRIKIYQYGNEFNIEEYYYSHHIRLTEVNPDFRKRMVSWFKSFEQMQFEKRKKNMIEVERQKESWREAERKKEEEDKLKNEKILRKIEKERTSIDKCR